MDFGATICVARKPKCDACPMTRSCVSYSALSTPAGKSV
jgi:adenine-specific DNA glycosylase